MVSQRNLRLGHRESSCRFLPTKVTLTMDPFSLCKYMSYNTTSKLNVYRTGMSLGVRVNPFAALEYPNPFLPQQLFAMIRGQVTRTPLERTRGSLLLLSIHKNIRAVSRDVQINYPLRFLRGKRRRSKHAARSMPKSCLQSSIIQYSTTAFPSRRN